MDAVRGRRHVRALWRSALPVAMGHSETPPSNEPTPLVNVHHNSDERRGPAARQEDGGAMLVVHRDIIGVREAVSGVRRAH